MIISKKLLLTISGSVMVVIIATTLIVVFTNRINVPDIEFPKDINWTGEPIIEGTAADFKIMNPVQTDFGLYVPQNVEETASVTPVSIESDLSNVEVNCYYPSEIKAQLAAYGFALVDEGYPSIYEIYPESSPKFITTDLCLHTYHVLYDFSLRILEGESFYYIFETMLKTLRTDQLNIKSQVTNAVVEDALNKNIAYLSVMLYLINETNTIPSEVALLANTELALIETKLPNYSAIFGYEEDYTQYKPRGHYTRHEILENYFRAMMYAGRIGFLTQSPFGEEAMGIEQTRMALLLISSFNSSIDGYDVWNYWDKLYEPTKFYVGACDDLTPYEYYQIWQNHGALEGDDLYDNDIIRAIIEDIKAYRNPKINSMLVDDTQDIPAVTKGLRLLGQRFIPDSYIFQQLVHDQVYVRWFPNALDVLSVLGSSRAAYLLQSENETYGNYSSQILKLREEFGNLTEYDWTQNLYWLWLYSLFPLLDPSSESFPYFMLNDLWTIKTMMTFLGSWAELRHDTILYAKQSYTARFDSLPPTYEGYVEPYPDVYGRLSSLVRLMKDGLEQRGLLLEGFEEKLENLADLFDSLVAISQKELQNIPLDLNDFELINAAAETMSYIASFEHSNYSKWFTETDSKMALVADVHTDPNTEKVLEVGVGNPLSIYVIVQDPDGTLRLTKGGTYSYYEFKMPWDQRMTDEEWQEMLETNPPDLPVWITNFVPIYVILQYTLIVKQLTRKEY